MNIIDAIIILVFLVNGYIAYKRGFILSLFKLISLMISIFLASKLYPIVSAFLRNTTPLYDKIKTQIASTILIQNGVETSTLTGQSDVINSLWTPNSIKNALIENNNPEVYGILNVGGLKEYIAGYIANICINIISMIIVLLVVTIGIRIIIGILDIMAKLPILNSINNLFGLAFGLVSGLLQLWIVFTIIFIFQANPTFEKFFVYMTESTLAKFIYEYNLLLEWVIGLFI
ncbi:MAG: CvpA family protein [Epulopiscium sp.]|nr:CvpA family protein [Candidatus Epulonipiscium sp.]